MGNRILHIIPAYEEAMFRKIEFWHRYPKREDLRVRDGQDVPHFNGKTVVLEIPDTEPTEITFSAPGFNNVDDSFDF
jgi:hypothetical protein